MSYYDRVTPNGAQLLSDARIRQVRLAELPEPVRPRTENEAYACQTAVVERWVKHYGGKVIGYKIACTNSIAQRQLNVDGPFSGRMMSSFCFDSPAKLKTDRFFMRVVEAEFGFLMARDLPPSSGPRERDEVTDAVEGVIPGIEVVDSRFKSWTTVGALSLIADNACHAAWVKGPLLTDWRNIDLAAQTVRVAVNGVVVREGEGSAVLGHPLNALQWLVNNLSARGVGLKAGEYITTGVTTDVYMGESGERIRAEFGEVGRAEIEFT